MSIYDVTNIEHCDITVVGGVLYRVVAHAGWYIHQPELDAGTDEEGNPIDMKVYRTVAILRTDYDFSLVEITAEADLPDNAVINSGGGDNNNHEVM